MSSFATPALAAAWDNQNSAAANDAVYNFLSEKFSDERTSIDHALHRIVRSARTTNDLRLVIYTFSVCYGTNLDKDLRDKYTTTIGGHSVYKVARNTDLCQRLALFFGEPNFWVRWQRTNVFVPAPEHTVSTYNIVLDYFPRGVSGTRRIALRQCAMNHLNTGFNTPPRPTMTIAPPPPPLKLRGREGIYEYDSVADAARDTIAACYDSDSE